MGSSKKSSAHTMRIVSLAVIGVVTVAFAVRERAAAQVRTDRDAPIRIQADICQQLAGSTQPSVRILRGNCRVEHGDTVIRGRRMVIWETTAGPSRSVDVYVEDSARVDRPGKSTSGSSLFRRLATNAGSEFQFRRETTSSADPGPLFRRAGNRRLVSLQSTLENAPAIEESVGPAIHRVAQYAPLDSGHDVVRRIRIRSRGLQELQFESFESNDTTPAEQILVLTGGVNMLIDGVQVGTGARRTDVGLIDLSADRMVVWTSPLEGDGFAGGELTTQSLDSPMQVYMEGNIEIRQGFRNLLRASHAMIDVRSDRALVMNAELKVWVPQASGSVRIRAERLRQIARDRFHAQNAWVSTSPHGKPGYRLQSSDMMIEPRYSGRTVVNPRTGIPQRETVPWVTALNNQFIVGDLPLFYTPRFSAPAEDPNIPIRRASIRQDSIFGFQVRTVWNLTKLLGVEAPPGTNWDLLADYMSERGPGVGAATRYDTMGMFGLPGRSTGEALAYYIHDDGRDNLGLDRISLLPNSNNRGRVTWRHRQQLPFNTTLFGEIGYLSDPNFYEQYYENEFDQRKDVETLVRVKQDRGNYSWSILARPQVNGFENTTEWLPRADFYGLSTPLFDGLMTWSSHSSAGYGHIRPGNLQTNPPSAFTPLPFLADREGMVSMSRHEIDMPFNAGALKIVPFAMGEAARWGEDFAGNERDRLVGSAGLRSSLTMWRVFPHVRSRVFNLNGLAHKVVFTGEYSYTDSSENFGTIPQYNEFDDNAQERFRNRLATNTFMGAVPLTFGPRFYAIRSGAGSTVTAPWHELVDDQQVMRFAVRQRLQTRVGPPGRTRIRDWMIVETGLSWFPDPAADNFGEDIGLLTGRYQWNVGDRTSLLAGADYDLFNNAQELWNVGLLTQRSLRGSLYLGYRQVKGDGLPGFGGVNSRILTGSYTYMMSPKWVSTFGTAFDFGESRNQGQSFTITRVGLDWLFHIGASYDQSKNNAGLAFMIEPRFGSFVGMSSYMGSLLGQQ